MGLCDERRNLGVQVQFDRPEMRAKTRAIMQPRLWENRVENREA